MAVDPTSSQPTTGVQQPPASVQNGITPQGSPGASNKQDTISSSNNQSHLSYAWNFVTAPIAKIWSFVSSTIWTAFDWVFSCFGFGDSKTEFLEELIDGGKVSAEAFAKNPFQYTAEIFQITLENPKNVREFYRKNQEKADTLLKEIQSELHKNETAKNAISTFDVEAIYSAGQELLVKERSALSEAMKQTCMDIGNAIEPLEVDNEVAKAQREDLIKLFQDTLPAHFSFKTDETFQAFYKEFPPFNRHEQLDLINLIPSDANISKEQKEAIHNLFDSPIDLRAKNLSFDWKERLKQNLFQHLEPKFYTELNEKLKDTSPTDLLAEIAKRAETQEGRNLLKKNLLETIELLANYRHIVIQKPKQD